jgi:SOS-response transcriptional repressor LexA
MPDALTQRQTHCLKAIKNWYAEHDYGPTLSEIGERMKPSLSGTAVARLVYRLEERGHVKRLHSRRRSISLI